MVSQNDLEEAAEAIRASEPSPGLQRQVPPDQEIEWVVERDLRTAWFGLILHKLKMIVFLFIAGIVAAMAVTAALGGLFGFLTFLLVGIGAPIGYVVYKYNYMKNTDIEYAGTGEQFIEYKNTPSTTRSDSLPINRAKDAKFRQDRWDKFLDTGKIHIQAIGGANGMTLKDVPEPEAVHRVVQRQVMEAEQVDDMAVSQGGVRQPTRGGTSGG